MVRRARTLRRYGPTPPWSGKPYFGLVWKAIGETWEGDTVWELSKAPGPLESLSGLLRDYYVPSLIEQLNQPLILTANEVTREPGQVIEYWPLMR